MSDKTTLLPTLPRATQSLLREVRVGGRFAEPRDLPLEPAHDLALLANEEGRRIDKRASKEQELHRIFQTLREDNIDLGTLVPVGQGRSHSVFIVPLPEVMQTPSHTKVVLKIRNTDPSRRFVADPVREVAACRLATLLEVPEMVAYTEYGSVTALFQCADIVGKHASGARLKVEGALQEFVDGPTLDQLPEGQQVYPRVWRAFDYIIGDLDRSFVSNTKNGIREAATGDVKGIDFGGSHHPHFIEFFNDTVIKEDCDALRAMIADCSGPIPKIDTEVERILEASMAIGVEGFKDPFAQVPDHLAVFEDFFKTERYGHDSFVRASELYQVLEELRAEVARFGI